MAMKKWLFPSIAFISLAFVAWLSNADTKKPTVGWKEIASGILRTHVMPYGYAVVVDGHALLIDAPHGSAGLDAKVERILVTHHHRDSVATLQSFLDSKVRVSASKLATEALSVEGVKKHWAESIPLRGSKTSYFVVPNGFADVEFNLEDGQTIEWRGKKIQVIATPGHTRDHLAFALQDKDSPVIFCGDAISQPGKIPTPFSTDWDHWTDAGLKPTSESLTKLAALKPKMLLPQHGEPIEKNATQALQETASAVAEVGFLRSFERYSRRLGNVPEYKFLVEKEQIASGGDKPWSKVSEHLFITGNTYVLVSKDNKNYCVIDPWGQRTIDQLKKLVDQEKLGTMEMVSFSHAHFDHYDGIYLLPNRDAFAVWTLDRVAEPIAQPFKRRAPFLDGRPVKIDRSFRDGEVGTWREFTFRFHHFPGQSEFTMAVETTIDGKKCLFTADNFFHQKQFSGSGGWMGLNRSFPLPYASSAKKVLEIAPEWILAEHGGPFEFNAEDFRRRVKWGEASAVAADRISPSGMHRRDWDPNRIAIEPILQKAKPGAEVVAKIVAINPGPKEDRYQLTFDGRGLFTNQTFDLEGPVGKTIESELRFTLPASINKGRHIFNLVNADGMAFEGCDAFIAIDVE
jgi:glyoxylase-like metal-dependent hydrolase (beta-lactamase superfamily II)